MDNRGDTELETGTARLSALFPGALSASAIARYSAESLTSALSAPAVLLVAEGEGPAARLLGRFERNRPVAGDPTPTFRRGSGGGALVFGSGRVYVNLRLETPSTLTPCEPAKLLNRYVRPLLRALTKIAGPSHYFGRDWISCGGAPIASVGFAHHARTGRAMVESVIAFSESFVPFFPGAATAPSFLGKTPTTVHEKSAKYRDISSFCRLVADSYAEAYGVAWELAAPYSFTDALAAPLEEPWAATVPEAMGDLGATFAAGHLHLGGALMASEDAVREFEGRVSALPAGSSVDDLGADADAVFAAEGVALFGVRSLVSVRDVTFAALERARTSR